MFCSELVATGLMKAGVIPECNASEQTPADIVKYPIYQEPVQIKGIPTEI